MKLLEQKLNVESTPGVVTPKTEVIEVLPEGDPRREVEFVVPEDKDVDDDFEMARNNIKRLLLDGEDALSGILDLAKSGEHPRAYEVAGQLVKTLMDANKDLIDIHKKKKDIKKNDNPSRELDPPKTINNTVFVGSTNELQKLIRNQKQNGQE